MPRVNVVDVEEATRSAYITRAREEYTSDDVQIDHDARVREGHDGVWVAAWVWLPRAGKGE